MNLDKYICTVPFTNVEIHKNEYFSCCPSWLNYKLDSKKIELKDLWNSKELDEIRDSMLDGSFKFCDKTQCPFLSKLVNHNVVSGPIIVKTKQNVERLSNLDGPETILMNFDRTCNYKCPSCRIDLIVENKSGIKRVEHTIEEIDKYLSKNVKNIYITGSGDPFVSVGFRNYLRNFDSSKYASLSNIHLHTNASMWNKEMWDSMLNVHKYVKSCEISIDAGTKDTYENKTRLGGNWDNLINNLKFIATIPTLKNIKTSFVVQESNYQEMETFADLMFDIFGKKVNVFFGKINNWGTFLDEEFKEKQVWSTHHIEHNKFISEFNKIWHKPYVFHNMHEFSLNKKSKNII